jgi:hypothetical protein
MAAGVRRIPIEGTGIRVVERPLMVQRAVMTGASDLPVPSGGRPRKKFRGRRRHFRRVMQQAAAFSLHTSPDNWWSYWHQHVDWAGRGNLGARHRHHYLLALALIFKRIASASHRIATPFQLFILLDGDDAGQDAVYLHSPNPNSDFPLVLSTSGAVSDRTRGYLQTVLPEFEVAAWQLARDDESRNPSVAVFACGVGVVPDSER